MNAIERITNHFLNSNEPKQLGNYATNGQVLIYIVPEKRTREILAVKFKDVILGNSSRLEHAPKSFERFAFGRARYHETGEALIQAELAKTISMVPFGVFIQAKLDITKFKLIQKGEAETFRWVTIETKYEQTTKGQREVKTDLEHARHFTGASLFSVDGEVFLFDMDRNELKGEIPLFNPFLVKLSDKKVKTIAEAYESLKPSEVIEAEQKGIKVLRQGEWFFIPVTQLKSKQLDKFKKNIKRITLQAGPNRPNNAKGLQIFERKPVEDQRSFNREESIKAREVAKQSEYFVTGDVKHSGREHKTLALKDWYKPVANTANQSWTVTGDID